MPGARKNAYGVGKPGVTAGIGAVFGLVGYVVAAGVGLAFAAARGYHVPVGDATMARYAVGHAVGAALLAAVAILIAVAAARTTVARDVT